MFQGKRDMRHWVILMWLWMERNPTLVCLPAAHQCTSLTTDGKDNSYARLIGLIIFLGHHALHYWQDLLVIPDILMWRWHMGINIGPAGEGEELQQTKKHHSTDSHVFKPQLSVPLWIIPEDSFLALFNSSLTSGGDIFNIQNLRVNRTK